MKRSLLFLTLTALLLMTLSQSAFALGAQKPNSKLTYEQAIPMLVEDFKLNIDNIRFIKAPKVTDYFSNLKDDATYADAFIIAYHNGLDIPKDVKPDQTITREQFAHHLFKSIIKQGDYAFIELFLTMKDEADVTPAYMDSVQKLLISKIAKLDAADRFHPKNPITKGLAKSWSSKGKQFTQRMNQEPGKPVTTPISNLQLKVKAVNKQLNEVTISADVPHPGYGIRVSSISFKGKQAIIHTEVVQPHPDKMYPQVITKVAAVTYAGSEYTPVLAPAQEAGGDAPVASEELATTHP
ncbi:S-layer homology domain-containing protein [Paenibacillus sp. GCM10023252]|uniref:S-layer homology domain-containing protein n=1 Tax=Paenibacillus sp. GCM10023252 TaxID=3252649 RepID=UPI0036087F68